MQTHITDTESIGHQPSARRAAIIARVARIVDYAFGVLYTLLLIRLCLEFFNARQAGFVQIIRGLTDIFYAPFRGIFETTNVDGAHLVWPLVVAVLGYILLHAGIRGLLRLIVRG